MTFVLRKPLVHASPWHDEKPLASPRRGGSLHRMRTGPREIIHLQPRVLARAPPHRAWIVSIWRRFATMLVRLGRRHHENHRLFGCGVRGVDARGREPRPERAGRDYSELSD